MYQLDQSISVLRVVGLYFSFLFNFRYNFLQANSGDPDQMPHYVASDLGLYCLPMSHKKDAMLIWVNLVQCLCPSILDIMLPMTCNNVHVRSLV